ncbi:MAG: hypothetical protein JSV52_13150 [Candidatus Zixiibacteriota bacterium]|nr:MAG: hypothetical protein JSV52_13150 [candidate division Zixibacteria bacterium]
MVNQTTRLLTVVLCVALCLTVSCGDDDSPGDGGLTPLPSLLGEYDGIYVYTTGYGTGSEETSEFPIAMRFSDQSYWLSDAGDQDAICQPSGDYVMGDNVELIQVADGCEGTSGDSDWNPTGMFALRQPTDSVVMTQFLGDTLKVIRLVPAQ